MMQYSVLELCAGGGGQAIGLEAAGFKHAAAVEIDHTACETLRLNRPDWRIIEDDIADVDYSDFKGIDLLAAGIPCPPFSVAGKQLGSSDDRDLFPQTLQIIAQVKPAAILLENVPGFAAPKFMVYRQAVIERLQSMGYVVQWQIVNSHEYGVPQLRPRFVLIGLQHKFKSPFEWPKPLGHAITVSQSIGDLMADRGWRGISNWLHKANRIAPTLVGGSKKHGGPDLGPTRAKQQWLALGVDGHGLANSAPDEDFPISQNPRLTVAMTARLQTFPDHWIFAGKKTASYRQVGNAFPSLVAQAVGESIQKALNGRKLTKSHRSFSQQDQKTIENVRIEKI